MHVDLFLPHLRTGGIEVGLTRLAPELMSRGLRLRFILQEEAGDLRGSLPPDCPCVALDAGGMWATARAYAALLRDDPADVVYSATNALNVAQLLAGRMLGAQAPRAVVGEHIPLDAFLSSRKRPWLRRWIMRATYGRAAAVVAPSAPILREHEDLLGAACPPCHVLPNPVVGDLSPPPALAERARSFVALGRLSPEKGFDLALRVMAAYRSRDPQATLTIYGDGPERAALEALRDRLGLADAVSLPGRTDDVPGSLARADLFLCTSQVEGFGNAIVEAQAAGVPVLSVDCPFGPRILLREGKAGSLVKSRNPEIIATALDRFASDQVARNTAQIAALTVAADYTIASSADAHVGFFQALMGQSDAANTVSGLAASGS